MFFMALSAHSGNVRMDLISVAYNDETKAQDARLLEGNDAFTENYRNNIEFRKKLRTADFLGQIQELVHVPAEMFAGMDLVQRERRRFEFQRLIVDAAIMKTVALAYTFDSKDDNKSMTSDEIKVRRMVANDAKAKLFPFHLQGEFGGDYNKLEAYYEKHGIKKTTEEDIKKLTPDELALYKKVSLGVSMFFANEIENMIDDRAFDVVQSAFVNKTKTYYDEEAKVWKDRDVILVGVGGFAAAGKEGVFNRSMKKGVITSMPIASGTTGIAGHQANGYQEWEDFYGMFDPMRAASELLKDKTMMLAITFELERLWGNVWNKNVPMFTEGHPRGPKQPLKGLFNYIATLIGKDRLKYMYFVSDEIAQSLRFTFRIFDGVVGERLGWTNEDGSPVTVRKDDLHQVEWRDKEGKPKPAAELLERMNESVWNDFMKFAAANGVEMSDRKSVEAALMEYKVGRMTEILRPVVERGELRAITEDTVDEQGAVIKSRRKIDLSTQNSIKKSLSEGLGINVIEIPCSNLSPKEMDEQFEQVIAYKG